MNTQDTLTHNGGSDSIAMAAAVTYAINKWGVDPNRVYVTGTSSGAMMTNVSLYLFRFRSLGIYLVVSGCRCFLERIRTFSKQAWLILASPMAALRVTPIGTHNAPLENSSKLLSNGYAHMVVMMICNIY